MRLLLIQIYGKLENGLLHHWVQLKRLKSGAELRIHKNAFAYTFEPKIWEDSCSSDRFLMLCVQNMCVEPILISLNPILTEFVMMLVSPHHRHFTASRLGRRCLYTFLFCMHVRTLNFRLAMPLKVHK